MVPDFSWLVPDSHSVLGGTGSGKKIRRILPAIQTKSPSLAPLGAGQRDAGFNLQLFYLASKRYRRLDELLPVAPAASSGFL